MSLDKSSFVPLYYQLADILRDKILNGEIRSGEIFPSENDLIREYGISRGTVREALRILGHEGLIERRKGIGTFVSAPKIEHETGDVIGFSRVMQMTGKTPSAKLLEIREFKAPYFVRKRLELEDGESVVFVKRLRFGDNEALLLEHSYFRRDIGRKLLEEDLSKSIYALLQEKFHYRLYRSENTIEAQLAEEDDADILGIEPGNPVLVLKRLVFLEDDTPFEYAEDIYRADRTKFKIQAHMNMAEGKRQVVAFQN